jgi:Raf kinase inhibitor-like YbhB/YbcL family protein
MSRIGRHEIVIAYTKCDVVRDHAPIAILRAMFTHFRTNYMATVVIGVAVPVFAQSAPAPLTVTSPTLVAGQSVPRQHTADGENISPSLQWNGAPPATKSFAIVCDDPDVPIPGGFVHWVIYNIPATALGVPENLPIDPAAPMPAAIAGAVQGLSGFKRPIYRGPAPPPGKPHHYHFTVYALDVAGLAPGLTKAQLVEAIQGHVIGQGELVAIYERQPPRPPQVSRLSGSRHKSRSGKAGSPGARSEDIGDI